VFRTNDFSSETKVNPIEEQNKELYKILKLDEDDFFLTTHLKSVELRTQDIERLINRGQRQIHY
jgi:pantothenate kinase-related protein Tda10